MVQHSIDWCVCVNALKFVTDIFFSYERGRETFYRN